MGAGGAQRVTEYLSVFFRAFLIVGLTAGNVRLVAQRRYLAAFVTGGFLSLVWWGNANLAAQFHGEWLAGGVYALGAAFGTVTGMKAAR